MSRGGREMAAAVLILCALQTQTVNFLMTQFRELNNQKQGARLIGVTLRGKWLIGVGPVAAGKIPYRAPALVVCNLLLSHHLSTNDARMCGPLLLFGGNDSIDANADNKEFPMVCEWLKPPPSSV
jgi:hypothetical protein